MTMLGAGVNLALGCAKIVAGYACHSTVLVSDGAHSLSDLLTDGVALVTYRASREPPDDRHPFGKGKIEAAGACCVGGALVAAGGGAGFHAATTLWTQFFSEMPVAEVEQLWAPAAAVAFGSILAKECMFRVTKRVGERERSSVIVANAYHHRSDALSSIASLAGVAGSVALHPLCDPLAGVAVALMVAESGRQVALPAINELLDASIEPEVVEKLRGVKVAKGVSIEQLRARKSGPRLMIDATLGVGTNITASAAHQLGEHAKKAIALAVQEEGYRSQPDIVLHFDPLDRQEATDAESDVALLPTPDRMEEKLRRTFASTVANPPPLSHLAVRYTPDNRVEAALDIVFPPHMTIRDASRKAERHKSKLLKAMPVLNHLDCRCDLSLAPLRSTLPAGGALNVPTSSRISNGRQRNSRPPQRRTSV